MTELETKIICWLANGERGLSSKAIAFKLLLPGVEKCSVFLNHPHDPDDIRRCFMLVDLSPEIRNRIEEMKNISVAWSDIIDNWDKIRDQLIEEVGDYSQPCYEKNAPKTYDLMKKVLGKFST